MKCWMPIFLLSFVIVIVPVRAQADVSIEVDPDDSPLVITGWLGEDIFVGNLRLTAIHGDVEAFFFLASDLIIENSDVIFGRQNVVLVGDPTLFARVPKNFQVKVTDLIEPGTYKGEIEIVVQGQARNESQVISLTVIAKARPVLIPLPGTSQVKLQLVNCQNSIIKLLDYFLARKILPKSAFLNSWQLRYQNSGKANTTVLDATTVLLGEHSGYQYTETELKIPHGLQIIPAKQIGVLNLTLDRTAIPPDHYTGSIFLTLDGLNEQVIVPVDLSVRIGPLWPGIVLIFGIVLGRVLKWVPVKSSSQVTKLKQDMKNLTETESPRETRAKNLWATVAGLSQNIRAKPGFLFWLRGIFYFCLIVLLWLVGMDKLYIGDGAYFGATPFNDYLGLFFWGVSADVASRTLSNVQGGTS